MQKVYSIIKIKNTLEWKDFIKSKNFPQDIPKAPAQYYKNEWKNLGDFLGIILNTSVLMN